MGGLGLRSAVDHALAAFVYSVNQSHDTVKDILYNSDLPCVTIPHQLTQFLIMAVWESDVTEAQHLEEFSQKALSLKIDLRNQYLVRKTFSIQVTTGIRLELPLLDWPTHETG